MQLIQERRVAVTLKLHKEELKLIRERISNYAHIHTDDSGINTGIGMSLYTIGTNVGEPVVKI